MLGRQDKLAEVVLGKVLPSHAHHTPKTYGLLALSCPASPATSPVSLPRAMKRWRHSLAVSATQVLAEYAQKSMCSKIAELVESLTGRFGDHQAFMVRCTWAKSITTPPPSLPTPSA